VNTSPLHVLYSTFPDLDQARAISHLLLDDGLIACANLVPGVISLYTWQGTRNEDPEVVMIAKVPEHHLAAAMLRLRELHPYDTPCITTWPLHAVDSAYLAWANTP
jgi:periplasmic divalent cation tolerance protein